MSLPQAAGSVNRPSGRAGLPAFRFGRNGSYVVFRKLHQRVAKFRRCLNEIAPSPDEQQLIAAKMMGRWRSRAPLAPCPVHDDPAFGVDAARNNDFSYKLADAIGYHTPKGSHIGRMNPRDADVAGLVRIHRMIRRGTAYGPPLPDGVLEDDGVDPGLLFAFVGAHLGRQFEFVQSEWMNDSAFFGATNRTRSQARAPRRARSTSRSARCGSGSRGCRGS